MKNPVHWFEIPATDIERAKKFYEAVLGIEITLREWDNLLMGFFPVAPKTHGATGALVKGEGYAPSREGTMIYFSVAEINDVTPAIVPAGGQVITPKYAIGEHGFCAHLEDTEGNRVSLHQEAEQ